MTIRILRACVICAQPATPGTPRCPTHTLPPRGRPHRRARAIILNQATHCDTCGCTPTPDNPLTLGHRIARAHGGTLALPNLKAECAHCNYTRGGGIPSKKTGESGHPANGSREKVANANVVRGGNA